MSQTAIDAKLEGEFAAVAASSGCELVHVEIRQGRMQVLLDRPQGVTLGHCQTVSKQLSALLDVAEFGSSSYTLEVSSPGLDRKFYRPEDYDRFRGQLVRVTFLEPEARAKKTIVGRLEDYRPKAEADGEISVVESQTGSPHEIPLRDILQTRLEIEL